jgi:putative transposase
VSLPDINYSKLSKYEEVYLHEYGSPKEARCGLTRYFDFYNHKRLHQALDYRTPADVYFN